MRGGETMTVQDCIDRYENEGIETIINDGVVVNEKQHPELWRVPVLLMKRFNKNLFLYFNRK